ncbi:SOS response regulatory protein OraA/RecX, interacts with RecA [Ruminococcaceae bacterium YAD3003]|nr:SOS response regulatory protein OraA/RecX, interacts with RecA [Ruminococcaceae bacterium YAD3003]
MSDNSSTKEAVTCAIRHIGTGVYSSGKIRIYLIQKGYSDSVSTDAVKHLVATGYIDDMRASRKVLAARSGKKQESRQYIYKRLLEAGIDSNCADDIVATLDCDAHTCLQLYIASFSGGNRDDYYDREDEFYKLAQLRGYNIETARTAYKMFLDSI